MHSKFFWLGNLSFEYYIGANAATIVLKNCAASALVAAPITFFTSFGLGNAYGKALTNSL